MATSTTVLVKSAAEIEIERLGFPYTEVADFDLTRLSTDRRVQVRDANHYAPKESVERYAIQMGEVAFPPIVVTSDDWIVDGNTRVGARLRRKEKFSAALVIDVAYESGTDKQQAELYGLAATLNSLNGVPLTPKEIRDVAPKFIALGWRTEQIGRAIGLSPAGVTAVKKEVEAINKLKRVGLDPEGLRGASLRALGSRDVLALNDVPFRELASLATAAGLNASEISSAAKAAKETGSDADALASIQTLRDELGGRIREVELTGVGKPPVSRQLRQHLGFVSKFSGREHELIETDPKVNEAHVIALTTAIDVLKAVLALQTGG